MLPPPQWRKQSLYHDEPAVQKFKGSNTFDALFSLRGLELVTVNNHEAPSLKVPAERVSEEEIKAFGSFLSQKLTQRKEPDVCMLSSLQSNFNHELDTDIFPDNEGDNGK